MEMVAAGEVTSPKPAPWLAGLTSLWGWAQGKVKVHKAHRRLRVCETLSLGEQRFVAVIAFDGQEFLVGGSGNSLELLARLDGETMKTPFEEPQCRVRR